MSDPFSRLSIVLLRPKSPGNVGAVARAMKNMGFEKLVIVDPIRYESDDYFEREARRMAWNATDVLDRRSTAPGLDAALAPFSFVAGTTSRPPEGAVVMDPRSLAAAIDRVLSEAPDATAAIIFGQEDIGLTREGLSRCSVIGSIPTAEAYTSMNLAQAALVFLYELRLRLAPEEIASGVPTLSGEALPRREQVDAFYERLEQALERIGFFQGTARPHMMRELRSIFNRTMLTSRELAILEGVVHRTLLTSRRGGEGG